MDILVRLPDLVPVRTDRNVHPTSSSLGVGIVAQGRSTTEESAKKSDVASRDKLDSWGFCVCANSHLCRCLQSLRLLQDDIIDEAFSVCVDYDVVELGFCSVG